MNTHQRHRSVSIPANLPPAEQITWDLDGGDRANRKFRKRIFSKMPETFSKPLAVQYRYNYLTHGERRANLALLEIDEQIHPDLFKTTINNEALKNAAKEQASTCYSIAINMTDGTTRYQDVYESINEFINQRFDIQAPPIGKNMTYQSALARLFAPQWWRLKLRERLNRTIELIAIKSGLVHRFAGCYVSNETYYRRREQKRSNQEMLEQTIMENEEGDEFSLDDLMSRSVANPTNRRNELMCRLSGFEDMAQESEHEGLFITITCPSRMHARHSKTGHPNKKYDGTSPREANQYLNSVWSRIRSKLKRDDIQIYGFRVAEPQHDGTPHWHLLLFSDQRNIDAIKNTFHHHALKDSPDEAGAKEHRLEIVPIDWKKGRATGYIAKYISKNVDGAHIDKDLYGNDASHAAERVDAWASVWGIRQFQQFGGAPVGIWRELRRRVEMPEGILETTADAADKGDWKSFVELMGGHSTARKDLPIKIEKEFIEELGKYKQPKGFRVVGVSDGVNTVTTRLHEWSIKLTTNNEQQPMPRLPAEV